MSTICVRRGAAAAFAVLPVLAGCARPASIPTAAATPVAPVTLLTRLGTDTIAIEQYTRTSTRMDGVVVIRTPVTTVGRYSVELGANGVPLRAEYAVQRGDGAPIPNAPQSIAVRYDADSVHLTGRRSSGDTSRSVPVRGELVPYVNNSYGLYELALIRLSAGARDSAEFTLVPFNLGLRTTTPLAIRLVGADSARINFFGNPLYARRDERGSLLELDGSRTTLKVRVERAAGADLEAIIREWTQREQAGAALGQASTRDTVRATIGRARLWIDYGRPALRGRQVWANGVLGDTLWRTGANAATQFRTDADLRIGGASVPAGTYTLWTSVAGDVYRLLINRQVGQWGTMYDAARDLVRVPLREATVSEPVERFTIAVEPQGARGGLLTLTWGTKQLSVPIAPR